MKTEIPALSRRQILATAGTGVAAVAGLSLASGAALASPEEVQAKIKELIGGTEPKAGKVTVSGPEIAENGNTVPIEITVDSPMTDDNYVKAVHVMADGNPAPGVASFYFTPLSGQATAKFRARLAQTQKIKAVALMSDGSAFTGEKEIKVTIGGCGG